MSAVLFVFVLHADMFWDSARQNKNSSPFLRLPCDIKIKIYTLVLGNRHLRIDYQPHVHRWRQKNYERFKEHIPGGLYDSVAEPLISQSIGSCKERDHHYNRPHRRSGNRVVQAFSINRTCRQIYDDTKLLYYELNTFSFDNDWAMKKWMKTLAPVQKRAIRYLVLPQKLDLAKYISKDLSGLRTVYIELARFARTDDNAVVQYITKLGRDRGVSAEYI